MTALTRRNALKDGLPILLTYLAVSATFGVSAATHHWSLWLALACSAWVYSGSTQFILLAALPVVPAWTAMLVGLAANTRHIAYSTSIAPYVARWRALQQAGFGFGLTDEVYALSAARLATQPVLPEYLLQLSAQSYGAWLVGTAFGTLLGRGLPAFWAQGAAFAINALFAALLTDAVRQAKDLAAAAVGGTVAVLLTVAGHAGLGILLGLLSGTMAGTLGTWLSPRMRQSTQR